ncbi:hypothetical protein HELRODRAFT_168194 [Helobdella robusta]|uniref:Ig-like domain-containing protein n=1 Tax=Helobdella robusta TaxID=6412 RepID=T1F0A3_HELRO|nr:hypothetical protein HELRODRAFT_168194 [Helobdella robusta]ESO09232.1 hypothetical protein HELRODRAFT_168194 [Helobdella robusta]
MPCTYKRTYNASTIHLECMLPCTCITTEEPYHFIWRPSPVYQISEGESVTLPCVLPPYTSYRPDVRWLKIALKKLNNKLNNFRQSVRTGVNEATTTVIPCNVDTCVWACVDDLQQNFTKRGKYELTKKIVENDDDDYNTNSINNLNNDINNINNDNNLTIHNITKVDAGTYECIASDANINSVASTRLIVQNSVFQAAHNLKVTSVENSIALSWLPAFINGHALHYLLWYRQLKDETTEVGDDNMRDSYGETDSYYKSDDYDDDNNEDEDERLDAEFDSSSHQNIPEHYKNLDRYFWQTIPIFSYDAHSCTLHGLEWNTLYEVMIMSRSLLDSSLEVFSGKTRIKTHCAIKSINKWSDCCSTFQ